MAQTTILAAGQTAATSTDVTVAAGSVATVGIFATGAIPDGVQISIRNATPGGDGRVDVLNSITPNHVIAGPGTFRVVRPDISSYGVNVGVYADA